MNDFLYIGGEVPYYKSRLFDSHGIKHAFFTRNGGVSEGAFSSLNFAIGTGKVTDSEENVIKNHSIAAKLFGLSETDICRSYQTHTSNVVLADNTDRGRGIILPQYENGVDGMVTAERNLLLSIRTADCVPILLCDTEKRVCAAVHSGWRGTVGGIAENAVELMVKQGASREKIIAAIGPCINNCCYEVGEELYDSFSSAGFDCGLVFEKRGSRYMLDLNTANKLVLNRAGIADSNISIAGICTKCNSDHFFSHRRDGVIRGTMSAMIHI